MTEYQAKQDKRDGAELLVLVLDFLGREKVKGPLPPLEKMKELSEEDLIHLPESALELIVAFRRNGIPLRCFRVR